VTISRRRAGLPTALIAAGLSCVAGNARADTRDDPRDAPAYVLTYTAPGACPSEASFIAEVARHVHDTSRAGSVRVNVTIDEREAGYAGTLEAFDRSGNESSRSVADKRCSAVAHALAFLAALVIEVGGHLDREAAPPAAPPPPPPVPPPAREREDLARPRSTGPSAFVLGGIRGAIGPGPRPSVEAGAEIGASSGVLAPSLRLGALVANGSPAVTASENGAGGSASLWLVSGRVEVCPLRFAGGVFVVRPCLGAEIGALHAVGQAAFAPRTATEPWVAAEATLRAQWFPTSRWFVEMSGGPVVPLVRTRYYFAPDQTLYSVPDLTAQAAIGAGLLF
jgi:hypothetical protein